MISHGMRCINQARVSGRCLSEDSRARQDVCLIARGHLGLVVGKVDLLHNFPARAVAFNISGKW